MSDWQTFGTHAAKIVGDMLELRLLGTFDETDTAKLFAIVSALQKEHRRVFLLVDASEVKTLTPAARRYTVDWIRAHPQDDGVAVLYGASPTVRAVASLLNSAVRVLSGRPTRNYFVKTEDEARDYISRLRTELGN